MYVFFLSQYWLVLKHMQLIYFFFYITSLLWKTTPDYIQQRFVFYNTYQFDACRFQCYFLKAIVEKTQFTHFSDICRTQIFKIGNVLVCTMYISSKHISINTWCRLDIFFYTFQAKYTRKFFPVRKFAYYFCVISSILVSLVQN